MFVVALPSGHATLAPWVVGDVCQAVLSEFVRGHALWALSRPRCPTFFNFFVVPLRNPVNRHSWGDLLPRRLLALGALALLFTPRKSLLEHGVPLKFLGLGLMGFTQAASGPFVKGEQLL